MKYVCDQCGRQLSVDRDLDDDRHFQAVRDGHLATECPRVFVDEGPGRMTLREATATE